MNTMVNNGVPRLCAVAFDMDGVLLSTDKLHFKAWQVVTRRWGIPFTEADNTRLLGLSREDCVNIVLSKSPRAFSAKERAAISDEKNALLKGLEEHAIAHEGVFDVLLF